MEKRDKQLRDKDLENVIGGMSNPAFGITEEEARKIAEEMDMGKTFEAWSTMSGQQFMDWWRKSNSNKNLPKGTEGNTGNL